MGIIPDFDGCRLILAKRFFGPLRNGASAGGLEALEQLLGNTPAGCGMAFVIIQHLDPTNKVVIPFADITAARGARKRKTMQDPDG